MPRAPEFRIKAMADILRQLAYAPSETRKRHMDAAERLVGEVDPGQAYPSSFVIFRITGYRPDDHEMVTFAGAALRMDLGNLVQRLSDTLALPPTRDGHDALELPEIERMLGVSAKTIQRYRREGLVCHVVHFGDGRKRLSCYADALSRFSAERQTKLQKAARFTRISEVDEARMLAEARELRSARTLTLNAAARIIARNHGRAHETIRQMLRKHDRGTSSPIFTGGRESLDPREVQVIHRAWMRGVDLAPIAGRFDRSRPAILRTINRRRTQLLRQVGIRAVELPTFAMEGADEVILSARCVCSDLLALPPHDNAFGLLDWASSAAAIEESIEDAMLGGWNLLKRRASRAIDTLPTDEAPTSELLDAIETDLRWATRLHRRLLFMSVPAAMRRIELNLGRSLVALPADQIFNNLRMAVGVIHETLESVDPSRGQRLERMVAFAMERELAQRPGPSSSPTRAAALHNANRTIAIQREFDAIDEWESWLEPWRNVRHATRRLSNEFRELLARRFGWDGRPPMTLIAIARAAPFSGNVTGRRMQQAIRELRAAVRRQIA